MDYNLSNLENMFLKISECVEYYEKTYLKNKSFLLYLGNGDRVKYMVSPFNLPHLLGIKDLNSIKRACGIKGENTIDTLKQLYNYSYTINSKISKGILNPNDIFSKFIVNKIASFKSNITSNADDILNQTLFVCKYKSERSWEHTIKNQKYDYIVVKQLENGNVNLLCLVENEGQFFAMSNQSFKNMEEAKSTLNELIKNQEITLLTGLSISNIFTDSVFTKTLYINQKLDKMYKMRTLKKEFDCFIDISDDYEFTINKLRSNRDERTENNNFTADIVNFIANHQIINREKYEDSPLLAIIDAWNDHICQGSSNNGVENTSYTKAIIDLKAIKQVALELEEENKKLETKVADLEAKNQNLTEENIEHKKDKEAIMKILKPEN